MIWYRLSLKQSITTLRNYSEPSVVRKKSRISRILLCLTSLRISSSLFLYFLSWRTFFSATLLPVTRFLPKQTTPKVPLPATPSISYLLLQTVVPLLLPLAALFLLRQEAVSSTSGSVFRYLVARVLGFTACLQFLLEAASVSLWELAGKWGGWVVLLLGFWDDRLSPTGPLWVFGCPQPLQWSSLVLEQSFLQRGPVTGCWNWQGWYFALTCAWLLTGSSTSVWMRRCWNLRQLVEPNAQLVLRAGWLLRPWVELGRFTNLLVVYMLLKFMLSLLLSYLLYHPNSSTAFSLAPVILFQCTFRVMANSFLKSTSNKIIKMIQPQQHEQAKLANKKTEPGQHEIKRTKGHEAVLKVKQIDQHIDMMRRRNKYLQVRDELNRSLTIQHERKIMEHQERRQLAKKDKEQLERHHRIKAQQIESIKEKNSEAKEEREKNITSVFQRYFNEKVENYETLKVQRNRNEQLKEKFKEQVRKQKEEVRKKVNKMEEESKINISRYKEVKQKNELEFQSGQYDHLMSLASSKEKQLEKLSKMEEQMMKKSSESMQASQVVRNRLREVLGDRRFTKLPSIKGSQPSTARGSTSNTQILIL